MLNLFPSLVAQYHRFLRSRHIPVDLLHEHTKWLRFYLDYCGKYHAGEDTDEALAGFNEKLAQKKQDSLRRRQAQQSVLLYQEAVGSRGRLVCPTDS